MATTAWLGKQYMQVENQIMYVYETFRVFSTAVMMFSAQTCIVSLENVTNQGGSIKPAL